MENGDLNWYVYGKFLAFAGPHAEREFGPGGYYTHRPEDYVPYFKRKNVTLVARLNKPYYDAKKFSNNGIEHMELYFLDGSNPPDHILNKFIAKCEETPGGVAVHCKAGLGRTGTCIAAYIMKHFRLTAEEIIGWMRITRPGSVIGPQQHYLKDIQHRMWRDGEVHRTRLTQQILPNVGTGREDNSAREENKALPQALSPTSPSSPNTARTSLGVSSSRMNKTSMTTTTTTMASPTGSSTTTTTSAAKSSAISMMSNSKTMTASPNSGIKTNAAGGLTSYRPSSRGNSRPNSSEAQKEENGENTQGDLLRIRRQQHLQQSAMYSLNTSTTTPISPNTSGKSSGSASSGSPEVYPGSGSNTPTAARPRSRLSGFLSSWNK